MQGSLEVCSSCQTAGESMVTEIKTVLDSLFAHRDQDWRFTLVKNWQSLAGPLHTRVRVEKVDENMLILGVYDLHWMQELYLLSRTIANQLNQALGGTYIHHIKFKLVSGTDRDKKPDKAASVAPPCKKAYVLSQAESDALEAIKDNELREALRAFLSRTIGNR